jgi:hypothetical protein
MRIAFVLLLCCCAAACGYHRLDHTKKGARWAVQGQTINLGKIYNNTKQGGLEEIFKKAVEDRIISSSPWTLIPPGLGSDWILQGTIQSYEVRPVGLNLSAGAAQGAAGAASRVEIIIVASLQLLDGRTGAVEVEMPSLTFRNQYQIDQNFVSFDNKELRIIEGLADDFAESFMTQLLEGRD